MNIESYREYCLQKPGTTEHFPFNEDTLVFKVMGKMYALSSLMSWENGEPRINLKCDPEEAIFLREKYPESVLPGYHMNKQLWNTVVLNGELTPIQVLQFIDDSYTLIVNSLTKKLKEELKRLD
ncbi:MmcQ/YjbR family DNA-binding protein [Leeuwenhoekiella blandensis]|uniref:Putative MmcQ-like protein n=1 Tax=Leeuwenhoekiella blandensis (strain CECT 7118 / CCUG 51940 / KCTC 22103 / MED217) TaxID=398720 RepID=A3XKK3_LEEBM|nr:MmcQ/YjbR family DNA-binding protein [Leeuwenhoekiella blandensis]EAQ49919.1 putative MmcQ-like protein [Leeuwenhoekiella blandensis MED217]